MVDDLKIGSTLLSMEGWKWTIVAINKAALTVYSHTFDNEVEIRRAKLQDLMESGYLTIWEGE